MMILLNYNMTCLINQNYIILLPLIQMNSISYLSSLLKPMSQTYFLIKPDLNELAQYSYLD